jgi:hypothetical protein
MLKQWILRWLGVPSLSEEVANLRHQVNELESSLGAQQEALTISLATHRELIKAELKEEFDSRVGCVLEASINASEKIARMVSSQGDTNLKEYIDSCLNIFEQTVTEQLSD